MELKEYEVVKSYNYYEFCNYLNRKYLKTKKASLFKHHFYEINKAGLSNHSMQKYLEHEERNTIIYCNLLEHLYLHILIAEHNKHQPKLKLGYRGAIRLVRHLDNYYSKGICKYKPIKYESCKDSRGVFLTLVERLNDCLWYYGEKPITINIYYLAPKQQNKKGNSNKALLWLLLIIIEFILMLIL